MRAASATGSVVWLVLALALWPVVLGGCEGTSSATSYIILEADTSTLAPEVSVEDAMGELESIIERRAEAFGARVREMERQGKDRVAVELSGITAEEARDLIGRVALLSFREPKMDEGGNFVCLPLTGEGEEFTVPPNDWQVLDDEQGNPVAHCGAIAPTGTLVWLPATGIGGDEQEKVLTGRFLTDAQAAFDLAGNPEVDIEFNSEGGRLFEQITARLVGLPLAIFLDEDPISVATVQETVAGGRGRVTGLDAGEARTLAIQLKHGALPVPVQVVAVGEGSLP